MEALTEDTTLKTWNIKAGKAMFAINSTIEEEILQHIEKANIPNETWHPFIMIFSKKNNTWLQLLEIKLLLIL